MIWTKVVVSLWRCMMRSTKGTYLSTHNEVEHPISHPLDMLPIVLGSFPPSAAQK